MVGPKGRSCICLVWFDMWETVQGLTLYGEGVLCILTKSRRHPTTTNGRESAIWGLSRRRRSMGLFIKSPFPHSWKRLVKNTIPLRLSVFCTRIFYWKKMRKNRMKQTILFCFATPASDSGLNEEPVGVFWPYIQAPIQFQQIWWPVRRIQHHKQMDVPFLSANLMYQKQLKIPRTSAFVWSRMRRYVKEFSIPKLVDRKSFAQEPSQCNRIFMLWKVFILDSFSTILRPRIDERKKGREKERKKYR